MITRSFSEEIIAKYSNDYLENAQRVYYYDIGEMGLKGVESVLYKDLPKTEVKGYPVASDYVDKNGKSYILAEYNALTPAKKKNCNLRFLFLPKFHEIYIGSTGSGKTTGGIEPQIRAISSQKNKPHLFITDPKGELFQHNARHLKKHGYRTYIVNFRDFSKSDIWNPLLEMYETKVSLLDVGNSAKIRSGKIDPELMLFGSIDDFSEDGWIEYDGKAFPTSESFDTYLEIKRDSIEAKVSSLVNEFANQVITIESKQDKTWEQGAQNLLKGILLCMLHDAVKPDSGFTKEMMTLKTVQDYYNELRGFFVDGDRHSNLDEFALLRDKPSIAKTYMRTALCNATGTSRSYCGVYEDKMQQWAQAHIFALTTGSTISLDGDEPFAIFISTRDYDKSDFAIAALFIDWVYRTMLLKADASPRDAQNNPTTRALHFLLDEFGNIPKIADFENKIATARSRNIWFHIYIQSYEQLTLVYEKETASVIKDNCNAQIFMGSQSKETKKLFSEECGEKWIPSIRSYFNPDDRSLEKVAVIPISDLDKIKEGQNYVKRIYSPVILSQYVRSYMCANNGDFADFYDDKAIRDLAPINNLSYNSPVFQYTKLHEHKKTSSFDF